MLKFTTAIFDMDGVIIDSQPLYEQADAEFLKRYGAPYDAEEISTLLVGLNLKKGTGVLKEKFNIQKELVPLFEERRGLFVEVCKNQVDYMPGFKQLHRRLKSLGFKTCVATSGDDYVIKAIDEKLKLSEIFGQNIFRSSQVDNKSKPNPAIFLYAAQKMGSVPQQCFVIEDAPRGIEAAKNAGMFCIALTGTFGREKLSQADIIVNSFAEISLTL